MDTLHRAADFAEPADSPVDHEQIITHLRAGADFAEDAPRDLVVDVFRAVNIRVAQAFTEHGVESFQAQELNEVADRLANTLGRLASQ